MSERRRRITAVLACHGRAAITIEGLAALHAQDLPPSVVVDVLIVDDGSPDDTPAAVARRFPDARILHGDGTLWWAGAMATGLDEAAGTSPDFLLWLNDDVRLDADAIGRLVACHDTCAGPETVVVGATRDPQNGTHSYGGQRRHPSRPFRLLPVEPTGEAQPCDTFQGNVVLVPLAVHRRLAGIDPVFVGVQGMADTDFGLRARLAGVAVLQAPGTVGACARNFAPLAWRDPALSARRRLAALFGPRGLPLRPWLTFARRHGGPAWPFWLAAAYGRRIIAALLPPRRPLLITGRPRAALMDGIMAPYRLPVLRGLAAAADWEITAFHGPAPANYGAEAAAGPLPLPTEPVRHLAWPGGRRIAWTGGTWRALTGGYDVAIAALHVHDLGVWTLWLARRLLGRPRLVLSGHFRLTPDRPGALAALRGMLRRSMARGADAVTPYTPRFAADCIAHGVDPDRVFVTHNTIDVAAVRRAASAIAPDGSEVVRRRLGLEGMPVFLFVGRLYAAKRVDLAITAVDQLRRRGRACALVVAGDGPVRDDVARAAAGCDGVCLLPASFDESELAPLFAMATAVVCPDSAGLLIVHAFAHGVPVVACRDAPGHGVEIDYLRHGENGLLAERSTAAALAEALAQLLDAPMLVEKLRGGARLCADTLTIDTVVAANLAALDRALGRPSARPVARPDPIR